MSDPPARPTVRMQPGMCRWCGMVPVSKAWFKKWCSYECAKVAMAAQS